ncbi:sialidase family protein [Maribacter ulvicola]|uniref:exo-alpha-sialidase n=1 Tax=Maribacter ulvicola TaxID=228959 RepID=A0A1N6XBP4_9FLAO|nr:sialidase family protein [Maribacter ulvicola]SIQ99697.1 BNR repeat-like domain-containing protein [Maribacter ulvicola]
MKKDILCGLILLLCIGYGSLWGQQGLASKQSLLFKVSTLFDPQTDKMGYHNYRIPSLLVTKKGTTLAIMEGREDMNHDHAKNDIVLKRSTDSGNSWSTPKVIVSEGDNVVMNPVLVQSQNGTIILTYIYFPEKRHSSDRSHGVKQVEPGLEGNDIEKIFMVKSQDEGLNWSDPEEITHIAKSNKHSLHAISGPGVGIRLEHGKFKDRIIIPMSETCLRNGKKTSNNYALYSDDNGNSWKHGKSMPASVNGKSGGNEIQMVELEDGVVMASIRDKGHRLISKSYNGGKTWSRLLAHPELIDTGSMSPLLRYRFKNGNIPGVLIYVGVTGRLDGNKRGKAEIALSYDDGDTWPVQKALYKGKFDYSSLAILPDGTIGMLAEYDFNGDRAKIQLVKFNLEWIEDPNAISLSLDKKIIKPDKYFKTHPDHIVPDDMVIQKFQVKMKIQTHGSQADLDYKFELIEAQGESHLLGLDNLNKFSTSNKNIFVADWYGPNIIKVTAKNKNDKTVAVILDTVFVHFSHSQVAGGDINKLDKKYTGKEHITGKIINDTLVYTGMRFLPNDISKGDPRYEGTKFGAYETKEPRMLALDNGILIASYHFQIKGVNDAPPGLTLVMTRSIDGGKTWIDEQILMQDINGVAAYTSMVQWGDEIHCYFSGGHSSHPQANKYMGVYKTTSTDQGKTWSHPVSINEITKLLTSKIDTIAPNQSPSTNALFIPDMEWKGKKEDAYIVPFYVDPVKFLITLDGGKSWDIFYDVLNYPEFMGELNEISWALLEDRTIYVVSRRQSKIGYKNEMLFDLKGNPTFIGQTRKNHKARRCHQGAVAVPEGPFKGRIAVASNFSDDREEATIAISNTVLGQKFTTKFLTTNAGWGYCHIDWNPKLNGFVLIGESEPFDENEQVVNMDDGPDRNERYSLEVFAFSPEFYDTLIEANINLISN